MKTLLRATLLALVMFSGFAAVAGGKRTSATGPLPMPACAPPSATGVCPF